MYTEEIAASRGAIIGFSILGALPVIVLLAVLELARLPVGGRVAVGGAALLVAAIALFLIGNLTLMRIEITEQALKVSYRWAWGTRIAPHRIATCFPIAWRGFGITYTGRGTQHYGVPDRPKNAVRLKLTNKAEVIFTTRHAASICDTLRAIRPEIALSNTGSPFD